MQPFPKPKQVTLTDIDGALVTVLTLPPGLRGEVAFKGRTFIESPADSTEYYEVPKSE